jgi:hypothetical protein
MEGDYGMYCSRLFFFPPVALFSPLFP